MASKHSPKHKHEHPIACVHDLKWCRECDVVYCEKCNKEWGRPPVRAIGHPTNDWSLPIPWGAGAYDYPTTTVRHDH